MKNFREERKIKLGDKQMTLNTNSHALPTMQREVAVSWKRCLDREQEIERLAAQINIFYSGYYESFNQHPQIFR